MKTVRTEKVLSLWSKTPAEIPALCFKLLKGEKIDKLRDVSKEHRVQHYA